MKVFYWVMTGLTLATFVPSALWMLLYGITGEDVFLRRSKTMWNFAKLFGLLGFNVGIWGHVAVGLWNIWFA